jgi:hypothetical protein
MKLIICSFLQPPVTSSLFGTHILPSTLFSNNLKLRGRGQEYESMKRIGNSGKYSSNGSGVPEW